MKQYKTKLETIVILTRRDSYRVAYTGQRILSAVEVSWGKPKLPKGKDLPKRTLEYVRMLLVTGTSTRLGRSFVSPCLSGRQVRMTIVIYLLSFVASFAHPIAIGSPKIDSLQNLLQTNIHDTTRINTLNALGWELRHSNPDTSIILCNQALKLAIEKTKRQIVQKGNKIL